MAVVEDILICWVQTGLHTIFYYLAGSWRALKFLYLPINLKKYGSRVLLTWVRSLPRSAPKLSQIPSSFSRSLDLALRWNCQHSWRRELPSPSFLIHDLLGSNSGTDVWKYRFRGDGSYSLRLYTQWFLASMSWGQVPSLEFRFPSHRDVHSVSPPSLKKQCSSCSLHGGGVYIHIIVLVAKLCLTLCAPMNCSQPGSSVHEISQVRILDWFAISFSMICTEIFEKTIVGASNNRLSDCCCCCC